MRVKNFNQILRLMSPYDNNWKRCLNIDQVVITSSISVTFSFSSSSSSSRITLDNNLTGDRRLADLKDRMRQCQKVFFNLKSALTKVEKQRRIFLRRQKPLSKSISFFFSNSSSSFLVIQSSTNDLLLPSTCT